jgi:hypothetical protein
MDEAMLPLAPLTHAQAGLVVCWRTWQGSEGFHILDWQCGSREGKVSTWLKIFDSSNGSRVGYSFEVSDGGNAVPMKKTYIYICLYISKTKEIPDKMQIICQTVKSGKRMLKCRQIFDQQNQRGHHPSI